MVIGSGFNPIYGLWVRFPCPNCVESHIWSLGPASLGSGFPVLAVLNPIYGFWVRFQSHIWSLGPVSLSHISLETSPLCEGAGLQTIPVPTVLNPMVFGSGFPVPLC